MRVIALFILLSLNLAVARGDLIDFDNLQTNAPPAGWFVTITGQGEARWTICLEGSAPSQPCVLQQAGMTPKASFPLCLKAESKLQDGYVEVKWKPVSGQIDQAGGVVWRAKDKDNYYVCRANALENNVVLYKVVNGKRSVLEIVGRSGGYGVNQTVAAATWHRLRVEFTGTRSKVIWDGKALFDVEDRTFLEAGLVGLWTKADSVSWFDDFEFGAL